MALNEQGYHRPTYDEILADKIQKAKDLFGEDIETSDKTPLGKFIRIGAYDMSKAYEDMEALYYSRFPNTATGVSLDRLCVFAGITRNSASRALHKIKVYGEVGTVIGMGELVVCNESGDITFYSINNYVIPESGNVEVIVECAEVGTAGNVVVTDIVNPITEIDRIEYIGVAEAGEETESDYNLRKRFSLAIAGAGSTNINAIRSALLRVPTVVSACVVVNDTDDVDEKGRPARSFECFVHGGDDYEKEIAEAIFAKAPIGIKTCSTSDNPVVVELLDNGGYKHTINFSHTENVNVYIKIKYKKNANFEDDGETQIKNTLVEYINGLGVGTSVIYSSLFGYIYGGGGVVDVVELRLSTNGTNYTTSNINTNAWQVAHITPDNILLEVVE